MDKIRLLIAEDERLTREALARLLDMEEDIEVVGRAPAYRGRFDLVVARSFGPPAVVAECGAPLLRIGVLKFMHARHLDLAERVGLVPVLRIGRYYVSWWRRSRRSARRPRRT